MRPLVALCLLAACAAPEAAPKKRDMAVYVANGLNRKDYFMACIPAIAPDTCCWLSGDAMGLAECRGP